MRNRPCACTGLLIASLAAAAVAFAVPPNDECTSATVIGTIPFTDTVDTSGATAGAFDPTFDCDGTTAAGQPSVWYAYTAATPISLQVDTFGSTFATLLFAYGGSCSSETGPLDCNEVDYDLDYGGEQSRVVFTLAAGETALIEVRNLSFPAGGSSLTLHAQESPVFRVSAFADRADGRPAIARSGDDFLVVWRDFGLVRGRRYDATGTALAPDFQVAAGGSPYLPDVAGSDDGFVVTWTASSNLEVTGRIFDATGSPAGPEFEVISQAVYPVKVAAIPTGEFMTVWVDDGYVLRGRVFDDGGTPLGADFPVVSDPQNGYQVATDVAADGLGNFIVVWTSHSNTPAEGDGDEDGIFGRRFDTSGTPLGAEFQVNTYTTGDQEHPTVAAADDGTFLVSWVDGYEDNDCWRCVDARRFDATATPLGAVVRLGDAQYDTDGYTDGPPVAATADDDGNFIVVWARHNERMSAVRIDGGGVPTSPPLPLHHIRDDYQWHPDVAAAPNGDFVVVWDWSPYGSRYDVMGRRVTVAEASVGPCLPQPVPSDCHASTVPEKSKLSVRDRSPDAGDGVTWKLARGSATTSADLGDALGTHAYALCLYDATGLVFQETVRPGGTCGAGPCWTDLGTDGFRYVDKQATQGPVRKFILKPGADGESRVIAKLKGDALGLPALPLTLPVYVQLQATNGECWHVGYPAATTNTATDFKAVGAP